MNTLVLNPHQQEAIEHIQGPLLVLAGAGSGKTQVVTARIAHLIEIGVPSSEIVAVTFTNKAAAEMQSRIKTLSNQIVLTCTFHSLCARILRESIHYLGYQSNFTIYDQSDSDNLLKSCLKSLHVDSDKAQVRFYKSAISHAKNELIGPDSLSKNAAFDQVYLTYQRHLKECNALDFDDLLFLTVQLFQHHPEVKKIYQSRWSFVLIDEYQDTNKAQYTFAKLLTERHHNIFAVGDPDQSIYSFRGANVQNILNFEHDFPNAKLIRLEQNYRSSTHILDAANHLIQNNQNRLKKNLWSDLGPGEKIRIYIAENEREEAQFVYDTIKELSSSFSLNDMVVFYRTNSQSRIYEDQFLKQNLPYQIIGGISFYARQEIKDVLSYLRVLLSPSDYISFDRAINLPKRGLGPSSLQKIRALAQNLKQPILDIAYQIAEGAIHSGLSQRQINGLKEFTDTVQFLKQRLSLPIHQLIQTIIERFRYIEHLKLDPESFADRKSNIQELISKALDWEEENENKSPTDFLEELSLKGQIDDHDPYVNKIRLMTIHNSKGLEFPIVFIVGMEEDIFPHVNCKETPDQIEEERRLAYVGITRSKKQLFLSAAKYRLLWGSPKIMQPSRFLKELPQEHIESSNKENNDEDDMLSSSDEFLIGTVVSHKSFGRGVIKKAYHTSLGLTYDVYFPSSASIKTLVAKYAKLQALDDL